MYKRTENEKWVVKNRKKKKYYFKNWFKSTKPGSVMRYSLMDMKCVD